MAALSKDQAHKMIDDFSNVFRTKRDTEAYVVGLISYSANFGKTPSETLKTIRNILQAYDDRHAKKEK